MDSKFAVLFIALVAIVGAHEEECGEEKAGACVEKLLSTILGDKTEEEACGEMRDVVKCLRDAADECLGEDRDAEIDEGLAELENLLQQNCPAAEEESDDEVDKCLDENQAYLLQCIPESVSEIGTLLSRPEDIDMNVLRCGLYGITSECIVDRSGEKCGDEARTKVREELNDMPENIREACEAQESVDVFSAPQLLELKKK